MKALRDPCIRPSATGPAGAIAEKAGAGLAWLAATILLVMLPLIFRTDSAIAVMCIIGISVVFALSYNMLLGQTGLLSFGHAIFFGLGGFCTIHVMNAAAASHAPVPLVVIPLVGGVGGLFFGVIFGSLASKRGGTIFAMISFGLGELVSSAAPILNKFFGGETGVTTDRSALYAPFGINFGPQIQVYYLIAGWCLISAAAMYFLTRTPLGQIMRAVRENPERIEFIGCSARQVRFVAFVLAAFFAGVAGALAAINFEIMTVSNVGGNQSAMVVLMTYIGGIGYFVGPILGAILITLMQILLSDVTAGWQMYLGILFVVVVIYAPGGLAALFSPQVMVSRGWHSPLRALLVIPLLLAALGGMLLIELGYQAGLKSSEGPIRVLFGISINSSSWLPWCLAIASVIAGFFGLRQGNLAADNRTAAARRPVELPHG